MQSYPSTDYLTGSELYFEYNDQEIQRFLDQLTPKNTFIVILDRTIRDEDFDEIEPWYKIRYLSEEIPDEWITRFEKIEPFSQFFMPEPNPFVITDFSLIGQTLGVLDIPIRIETTKEIDLWYKPNSKFGLPHTYAYISLFNRCSISIQT